MTYTPKNAAASRPIDHRDVSFRRGTNLNHILEVCHMNRIDICKNIIQSISEYITNPDKLEPHKLPGHFVRNRKLSVSNIIHYLFFSSKASMFQNLSSIRDMMPDLNFPQISKQAISKARQFLSPDLFKELFYLSVDSFYQNLSSRKKWHGYHIFAIDGSKFELPNSKSTFDFFGEMFGYPDPSRRFTMGLASIVYDVLDDYIVHASFHRYLASERAAAREHLNQLEALGIYNNSIVIFDRGYYSEAMFRYCIQHNHICLMRLKDKMNLCKRCKGDSTLTLEGNKKLQTQDVLVRVIAVTLDDGSKEYLATNLFDKSITADMFRELYFLRWPVELKYKELKSLFKIEDFNGATSTSVFQEFFLNMLLSNLASLIKNEADEFIDKEINSKPQNKHRYQANRSFVIGRLKRILPRIISSPGNISLIENLFLDACECKSQIIPGRKFKRKKNKAVGRTHFRNKKVVI